MTTISRPNKDALIEALDAYRDAMRPFIIRSLKTVRGQRIEDTITHSLNPKQASRFQQNISQNKSVDASIDVGDFPSLIGRNWRNVFQGRFSDGDQTVQNASWLIKDARDKASHPSTQDLDSGFTTSRLFDIADVLGKINAHDEKRVVERIRDRLITSSDQTQTSATEPQLETDALIEGEPSQPQSSSSTNLSSWRSVILTNPDVAQGDFQQSEFAADLQQVYDGRADATQYGNPVSFFNHTYVTPGIRTLLVNTLKRLADNGGDPVIQTKTGFGGGKTHSLIALYHLVNSIGALTNSAQSNDSEQTSRTIRAIMEEAGLNPDMGLDAKVAVLDCTFLSPTSTDKTDNGDPLNTLWGEMAYQLGGQEAYEVVGEAARQGIAPGGGQLDHLFQHVGRCIILIDELVAYVRNAVDSQDSIYTFIQALTQAVRRNRQTALVVTLPEHAVEAGGDRGIEALSRLDSILGRIEATWEPLEINETFEVVRRRLFGNIINEAERDRTCEAFAAMYGRSRADYPQGVGEQRYLQRMKDCYPIHPEIFDRLYSDWSSIPRFQRTRAVLRMMATCISRLHLNADSSPLIMPANLTLSDSALANEFARLLDGNWAPVLSELDSDNSRTDNIDKNSQRFGNVGGAARRIARTVFLGSAPSGNIKGIDNRNIRLGVVQPGHGVSVYNEALGNMSGDLYYMYVSDGRYYFHAEENLNKVATDRSSALITREVDDYILEQVKDAVGRRSDVIVFPTEPSEVSDTDSVRLVILPPDKSLSNRSSERDDATPEALRILLNHRSGGDRSRRNTLLFLAARKDEVRNLVSRVRNLLAWDSILNGDRRIENLEGDRRRQAIESSRQAGQDVRSALVRAYRWAMAPVQDDPQSGDYRMNVSETAAAETGEIAQGAFDKFIRDEALVEQMSPSALDNFLQRHIWSSEQNKDHVQIDTLWNMMTSNVYMHRLRNKSVLTRCIEGGVLDSKFGYAEGYDPNSGTDQYGDLHFGEPLRGSTANDLLTGVAERRGGLLVNPEMAELVMAEQRQEPDSLEPPEPPDQPELPEAPEPIDPPTQQVSRRIVVNKTVQNDIDLNDISLLREEIIRNLGADGGAITISITISAQKPDGFSESIARSIRENAVQLGLEFEENIS